MAAYKNRQTELRKDTTPALMHDQIMHGSIHRALSGGRDNNAFETAYIENLQELEVLEANCATLKKDNEKLTGRLQNCTCEHLEAANVQLRLDLDEEMARKIGLDEANEGSKAVIRNLRSEIDRLTLEKVEIERTRGVERREHENTVKGLKSEIDQMKYQSIWQFIRGKWRRWRNNGSG